MKKVEFLLIQLEGFLYLNSPTVLDVYSNKRSGNIYFKDDLKLLYEWNNGINTDYIDRVGRYQLCGSGYFISFEESIKYQELFIKEGYFAKETYYPIIASLTGDFLLVDTSKKNSKVFIYSPSLLINEPMEIYNSVESFIETIYECFIQKAYYYDDDNFLTINDELEQEITIRLNPKSEFWK